MCGGDGAHVPLRQSPYTFYLVLYLLNTLAETARLGSAEVSLRFRDVQLALDGSDVGENDTGLAGPTVQARGCALKRRLDARCSSWSLLCDRHEGARRGVIAEVLSGGRYA